MYFRKTNKNRSEMGISDRKRGLYKNPPGRVGISPGGYKRGMFQDQKLYMGYDLRSAFE